MISITRCAARFIWLFLFTAHATAQDNPTGKNISKTVYFSLDGKPLNKGNTVEKDGCIHQCNTAVLHLLRTKNTSPKGTVLLLVGGGYELLDIKNEGEKTARFLNSQGFDAVLLEYRLSPVTHNRDLSLTDALAAFRLMKTKQNLLSLHRLHLNIMGIAAGAHLAARTVQKLSATEQPDDLILISPSFLDETSAGTVFPAIMPPWRPTARLFASFYPAENKAWINSCREYAKTWKGFDGQSTFILLADSNHTPDKNSNPVDDTMQLTALLKKFLSDTTAIAKINPNPAAVAVAGYAAKRHAEKLALVAKEKFNLIMIGNSITNNFEKPEYQSVWNQFFAPRKALNLGTSGYRTENIIWNIENGELDGQSPKVVVVEIGTNNIDEKNYPTRHTAAQLAGGIDSIVKLVRIKLPDAKIVVLRCFPGCYGGPNPTSHRMILERASDETSKLADGKHVFYCDVNHVFLNMDGSINHDMMPDWLHPSPAGAKAWAQAMEPLLSELMGDQSLDTSRPFNTAIVPVSKLEEDSYNWWNRHAAVLRIKDSIDPEIVLIGNSITHFWGGEPALQYADGKPRVPNGPKSWDSLFAKHQVLNLGFGWDRTQNVLWRLDHGELDGLHPRLVVIDIGTNNTSQTNNARMNTAAEIVEGIRAVCLRVRSKIPSAKIVLMSVFPREQLPGHPRRLLINEINKLLESFATGNQITLVNIGPKLLFADGVYLPGMTSDFCHPTDKGYQVWADAIRPFVDGY